MQRREAWSIRKDDLADILGPVLMWPWDAAKEPWIDFDAFEEAFRKAVEEHRIQTDLDVLNMTFRRARGMRRRVPKPLLLKAHSDGRHVYLTRVKMSG